MLTFSDWTGENETPWATSDIEVSGFEILVTLSVILLQVLSLYRLAIVVPSVRINTIIIIIIINTQETINCNHVRSIAKLSCDSLICFVMSAVLKRKASSLKVTQLHYQTSNARLSNRHQQRVRKRYFPLQSFHTRFSPLPFSQPSDRNTFGAVWGLSIVITCVSVSLNLFIDVMHLDYGVLAIWWRLGY